MNLKNQNLLIIDNVGSREKEERLKEGG